MSIDDTLQELANTVYQHGKATRTNTPFHYGEPIAQAKQALYKDTLELIGEMEHTVVSKEDVEDELDGGNAVTLKQKATTARNQLRQELLTKAKEYYGVEE